MNAGLSIGSIPAGNDSSILAKLQTIGSGDLLQGGCGHGVKEQGIVSKRDNVATHPPTLHRHALLTIRELDIDGLCIDSKAASRTLVIIST